jgi:L-cysteine:1D-myo-inositol 2-amino-2-deoxy-alpha-D-glucopyranoside ligase
VKSWPSPNFSSIPGSNFDVRIFDSITKTLTNPVRDKAKLYVCGITPYDATHIGHASTYIAFDLLNRTWRDAGLDVKYAQNITDIDDPLLERATAVNRDWQELAEAEINLFRADMTALRVIPPDFYISVTEHMDAIINWIKGLIESGIAYKVEQDWYFDSKVDSTQIQHIETLVANPLEIFAERGGDPERVGKRNPFDPLLWRGEREGEPAWYAPFGMGRPGWHIECLAIAKDFLGGNISVQGGGEDLVFPHHYMCEVIGEAASKENFATTHVHAGLVSYLGEKMSKSRGNLVFVSELLRAGRDPMAIRLTITKHHYRSQWEWTEAQLKESEAQIARWRLALSGHGSANAAELVENIRNAMRNDLDSPKAISAVDDFMSETLKGDRSDVNGPGLVNRALDTLLGIAL